MTQLYSSAVNITVVGEGKMYALVPALGVAQIVYPGITRIYKVLVTTATTGAVSFYDNGAGSTAGTPIFVVPSGAAVGTIYDVQIPCNSGITVGNTNSGTFGITLA
jgi:hypothetical protein